MCMAERWKQFHGMQHKMLLKAFFSVPPVANLSIISAYFSHYNLWINLEVHEERSEWVDDAVKKSSAFVINVCTRHPASSEYDIAVLSFTTGSPN